ncbi:TonB-dependent receptor [Arenicella sp.]|nr:TonB-dependent receptor [Arenicella sp.]
MKLKKLLKSILMMGGAAVAMSQVPAASAQLLMEEIVVTAQKRQQSITDVNLSVTAFTGDDMDALGFSDSTDISSQTPGLSIGTPVGEGNNPSLVLRGVGINDFNDNNESTVSLYIDEVYLGALAGQTFQLFDTERVEILRGPQGTLYGRNSTGGLIHYISKKPNYEENDGYVSINVGENALNEIEFGQNILLTDSAALRVALAKKDADGYVENRSGEDANESDSFAYRVQLAADLNDSWSLNLNAHGGESDTTAPQYQHEGTASPDGTDFFGYSDNDGDPFAGDYGSDLGVLDIETNGQSIKVTGVISDNITFTSISALESVEKLHVENTDVQPAPLIVPTFAVDHDQFSQEFRLNIESGLNNYIFGAYYYDADIEGSQDLDLTGLGDIFLATAYTQDVTSTAIFGQGEFALSETLGATIGLRYTDEDKDFTYSQDVDATLLGAPPGFFSVLTIDDSFSDEQVSGTVGVDWTASDATKYYANISSGFKSGGFNVGFGDGSQYDSETLTSYEVGVKTSWGSSRLSSSAFYYDYSDLQALTFDSSTLASAIANASDAEVYGLEVELISNVTDNFFVNLGVSLLDTNIDSISTSSGIVEDRNLVLAPDVSVNWLARYRQDLSGGGSLAYQVSGIYSDDQFFDVVNQPVSRGDSYTVWDARISWLNADENLELALWAKNFTDEEYLVYTFDFSGDFGFNQQFFGKPSWIGASLKYDW